MLPIKTALPPKQIFLLQELPLDNIDKLYSLILSAQ